MVKNENKAIYFGKGEARHNAMAHWMLEDTLLNKSDFYEVATLLIENSIDEATAKFFSMYQELEADRSNIKEVIDYNIDRFGSDAVLKDLMNRTIRMLPNLREYRKRQINKIPGEEINQSIDRTVKKQSKKVRKNYQRKGLYYGISKSGKKQLSKLEYVHTAKGNYFRLRSLKTGKNIKISKRLKNALNK